MPIFETQRVWRIEAFEADNRSWLFFFGRTGPPARLQCPPYICPETPAWSKTDRLGEGARARAPLRQTCGHAKSSSRNVRHEEPRRHALLEMPDHTGLVSWNRDRERLSRGRPELDDISAVRLRSVDHNSIHPSASRFTAGASDFPDRSSIRDRSDCGRHPLWRCLGSRIEYRIA